ncbi:hypothetical protein V8C86DRAFT_2574573 [Haematococcus lacustris]
MHRLHIRGLGTQVTNLQRAPPKVANMLRPARAESGGSEAGASKDSDRKEALQHYRAGEVVEVTGEEEVESYDTVKQPARMTGAVAGAVMAGCTLAAVAGLPAALAGAAVGAVAGGFAASAVAKEWVRGENIGSAMEFDQPDPDDSNSSVVPSRVPGDRSVSPRRSTRKQKGPSIISIGGGQVAGGVDMAAVAREAAEVAQHQRPIAANAQERPEGRSL